MICDFFIFKHSVVHKEAYDISDIYELSVHLVSHFVSCR